MEQGRTQHRFCSLVGVLSKSVLVDVLSIQSHILFLCPGEQGL